MSSFTIDNMLWQWSWDPETEIWSVPSGGGSAGTIGYTGSASTEVGYTGSKGDPGNIGYTGSQGIQGDIGYTGSASTAVGYTGSRGDIGYTGSAGFTGSASTVIGYTGSQGVIGYTGSRGTTGFTGSASTAVGFTGSRGYTGSSSALVWTQIGSTQNTTSGSSWSFSSIPTTYKDLRVVYDGISSTAIATLTIEFSNDNGTTWSPTYSVSTAIPTASGAYGTTYIIDYQDTSYASLLSGNFQGTGAPTTPRSYTQASSTDSVTLFTEGAAINALRISVSAGTGDAGTVALYGR